jgi:hypothetical protein
MVRSALSGLLHRFVPRRPVIGGIIRRQEVTAVKRGVWVYGPLVAATLAVAAKRIRRRRPRAGVALVCGGSRGLGLPIARELAARGFRLAICARIRAELVTSVLPVVCGSEVRTGIRAVNGRFGSPGVETAAPWRTRGITARPMTTS